MSKTNNMTDFLTGIADKLRLLLGTEDKIPVQSFEERIEQVYEKGKGESTVITQEKQVTPGTDLQRVTPDTGYHALSAVTVLGVTSSVDGNILPENIKKGVSVLGVTGSYEGQGGAVTPAVSERFCYCHPQIRIIC